ncbi:MAG: hypothetical protein AAF552_12450, partial [Pseudomonadota bacterium]
FSLNGSGSLPEAGTTDQLPPPRIVSVVWPQQDSQEFGNMTDLSKANPLRARAALVLTVPLAGVVALVVFEVMGSLGTGAYDASSLPPTELLIGLLCVAALPVLALCVSGNAGARWLALIVAGLMTLFHALHVVEHAMAGDYPLLALIAVTMLLPSGIGVWLVWQLRKASAG